jgi:hypothetical protein
MTSRSIKRHESSCICVNNEAKEMPEKQEKECCEKSMGWGKDRQKKVLF